MTYLLIVNNEIAGRVEDLTEVKSRAVTLAQNLNQDVEVAELQGVAQHKVIFNLVKDITPAPDDKPAQNKKTARKPLPVQAEEIPKTVVAPEIIEQPKIEITSESEHYMSDNYFSLFLEDFQKALKKTESLADHAKITTSEVYQNLLSKLSPEQAAVIKVLRQENNDRCAIKDLGVELCDVHNWDRLNNVLNRYPEKYQEHHKSTIENLKKEFKTPESDIIVTVQDSLNAINDPIPPVEEDSIKKQIRLAINNTMTKNAAIEVKDNLKDKYPGQIEYIKEVFFKKVQTFNTTKEPTFAVPDPSN